MEIKYELTKRDFYEALIAHQYRSKFSKCCRYSMPVFIAIFLGVSLLSAVFSPISQWLSTAVPMLLISVFWAGLLWGLPWLMAGKQFVKQPLAHGSKTGIFDAAGIHWFGDSAESKLEWKHYIRVLDSKNHFLFYISPFAFNIVPKRAFTAEQIADLRELIANHILQGK